MKTTCGVAAVVLALAVAAGVAHACDYPVYEYSLLHWARQNYHVFQFQIEDPQTVAPAELALSQLADGGRANLVHHKLDPDRTGEMPVGALPRRIWERHEGEGLPLYVVVTPNGDELFAGALSADDVAQLVMSEARLKLAALLNGGKEGLLLLLTGADESATTGARQIVESALERAREAGDDVGWLIVDREDPGEEWLVRQLVSVRPDLPAISSPMLFGVFGKGYAVEPFTGQEITAEAVQAFVGLFKGPCSCDLVYQILGANLLTDYDWDAVAYGESVVDDSPYYSLLAAPQQDPEPAPTANAPRTEVAGARPQSEGSGGAIVRNIAVTFACMAAAVVAVGMLVLKRRGGA